MPPIAFSPARTPHLTGTTDGLMPFIGRRGLLRAAGLRTEAGRGTVLTGPPGIGKSRTLQAVAGIAERSGSKVAELLASRAAAAVPFGAFLGLLDADTLQQASTEDALGRAAIIRRAVLELGLDVLVVDDAHLLDDESAALLHDLTRAGTVVALAIDPASPAPDVLFSIPEAARAESVELPPLSPEESAQFAEAVLQGVVDGDSTFALHAASGGVPLLLRELIEHQLRTGGIVSSGDVLSVLGPMRAPTPIDTEVRAALRGLDPEARSWVELVAVAGSLPAEIGAILVADGAADRAEAADLVRIDRTHQYELAQSLHREPVLDGIGSRSRHRSLRALIDAAAALDRPLTEAERVLVGRWRIEAGESLARGEALELATATSPSDPALKERFLRMAAADGDVEALIALAQHLVASGQLVEAEQLLWRAEATGGAQDRIVALLAMATGLGDRRSSEALVDVDRSLAEHPASTDLLGVQVALLQAEGRSGEAAEIAQRLLAAPESGAGTVLGGVYGAMAMVSRGDTRAATAMAAELRPIADRHVRQLPEGPMLQAWLEAAVPWAAGRDSSPMVTIAQAGYDSSLREGLKPDRARFAHLLAVARLQQGEAAQAVRLLREAEAVPCFWRDSQRPDIVANLVDALVLAGDVDEAERTLERLEAMRRTPEHDAAYATAVAAVRMGRGDLAEAARVTFDAGVVAQARGEQVTAADAWTAALRYGSREAAERLLSLPDVPEGSVREDVRALAAAVVEHDPKTLLDAAGRLWRADARLLAVESAATAARWSVDAGDTVHATTATELLLRWTVATPGLVDPLADALPLAGLTVREQEIVRMAASGLQDREIATDLGISVRTAQTHLGRAFNKLGIHRRQQLTRLLPAH